MRSTSSSKVATRSCVTLVCCSRANASLTRSAIRFLNQWSVSVRSLSWAQIFFQVSPQEGGRRGAHLPRQRLRFPSHVGGQTSPSFLIHCPLRHSHADALLRPLVDTRTQVILIHSMMSLQYPTSTTFPQIQYVCVGRVRWTGVHVGLGEQEAPLSARPVYHQVRGLHVLRRCTGDINFIRS